MSVLLCFAMFRSYVKDSFITDEVNFNYENINLGFPYYYGINIIEKAIN